MTSMAARRHLRVWRECFAQAVRRDLHFRSQALITAATAVLDLGLSLIPVLILVGTANGAGGWTGPRAVAVVGAYTVGAALIDCFVAPNLQRIDGYVRRGDLDLVLLRPVSAPLYTALRWVRPAELTGVLTGAALVVYGLSAAGVRPAPGEVLTAMTWGLLGTLAYSLLWANLAYLAFWLDSAEPVNEIAIQLRSAGQYPLPFYPRGARTVLTSLIPAGLIGALPVSVLSESPPDLPLAVAALGVVLAGGLTLLHWRSALRRYASASS